MVATALKIAARELETRPLKPGFGVEILDLDLATAPEEDLLGFDAVFNSNPVVVVRNQTLTAAQVVKVSERMGRISAQHRVGPHPEFPAITILSNKKVDGKPIGAHEAGRNWHTDGTTYAKLGLITMLYGIECPPEGGDTLIADAATAYDDLTDAQKSEVDQIQVVHNRAHLIQKYNRAVLTAEDLEKMKDVLHPAVVTSPLDGRKAFFLTNGSTKGVVGMSDEDGVALVKKWINHVVQDKYVYRHQWQAGDVLIWNDMCTMHSATHYDDTKYDRLVYRTWMRPFDVAASTTRIEEMFGAH